MAQDQNKVVTSRRWPLSPVNGETSQMWCELTTVTKDLGQPTQTTELSYECEFQVGRTKLKVVVGATLAEMDANLNILRQAVVDARSGLATM